MKWGSCYVQFHLFKLGTKKVPKSDIWMVRPKGNGADFDYINLHKPVHAVNEFREFGFSEKAVGMTVVAIGTSLPELFVTLMALSKKEVGISLGNIIGSNIFNILFVLGVVGMISPLEVSNVSFELFFGVGLLLLLALLSFFYKGLNKLSGFLLVSIYVLFLYLQFYG